jgi:Patatin-like phospholipase
MTSNEVLPQESTAPRKDRAALPGEVVLVMQGGGAPGCYQAGAYHALHEAGIEPDWIIGTSIGAINGAIIAGNEASDRVQKLKEFWQRLDCRLPEPWSRVTPVVAGVPGFYYVNPALAWVLMRRSRSSGPQCISSIRSRTCYRPLLISIASVPAVRD